MRAPWTLQELGSAPLTLQRSTVDSLSNNQQVETSAREHVFAMADRWPSEDDTRTAPHDRHDDRTMRSRDDSATQHRTHARRWREPVPKASTKGQALSAYNTIQRASEANLIERHPRSGAVCRADSDEMRMVQGSWHPSRQCRSSLLRPPSRSGHQRENPSC